MGSYFSQCNFRSHKRLIVWVTRNSKNMSACWGTLRRCLQNDILSHKVMWVLNNSNSVAASVDVKSCGDVQHPVLYFNEILGTDGLRAVQNENDVDAVHGTVWIKEFNFKIRRVIVTVLWLRDCDCDCPWICSIFVEFPFVLHCLYGNLVHDHRWNRC